jgi:hypothetical protein
MGKYDGKANWRRLYKSPSKHYVWLLDGCTHLVEHGGLYCTAVLLIAEA